MIFAYPGDSHRHSLQILNKLYEYDDFMSSVRSMVDLGCGTGEDLIWWATRTTRDDSPQPLNIRCTGIDLLSTPSLGKSYLNVSYQQANFEESFIPHPGGFDVLWCHDAFQFAIDPIKTLSNWWHMTSAGGMLALTVPATQQIHLRKIAYHLPSGCYYHHTLVSLMYMLATTGWCCATGFFKQTSGEPWIHAIVYKSKTAPLDPRNTSWHQLSELGLLPDSAKASIQAHNFLRQQDLILPWIDQSLASMANL